MTLINGSYFAVCNRNLHPCLYVLKIVQTKQHQRWPCLVLAPCIAVSHMLCPLSLLRITYLPTAHLHKHSQLRQTCPRDFFFFLAINKLAHHLGHYTSLLEHLPTNQGHGCSGGPEEIPPLWSKNTLDMVFAASAALFSGGVLRTPVGGVMVYALLIVC